MESGGCRVQVELSKFFEESILDYICIFGVSPLKFQLRVFYGYMKERDLLDSNDVKFPKFSKAKHRILCFELKQLYVAITRTRQRLWICENVDFSKPMFDYWKKLGLFQLGGRCGSIKERDGDSFLEKLAKSCGLRVAGVHMLACNAGLARVARVEAAEIYESIGMADIAAKCFMEFRDFKRAGIGYFPSYDLFGNRRESRLEDVGDCFSLPGCWSTAADVYSRCNCFSKYFLVCTK
ncbi:hypothetical protein C5167_031461 [Papaver somniferum]|uniref:DNA helicase n=1 Tax=Papaver somniferum TaxID=3469 RepID=A0A4Y7K7B7_PAPSO|nr:hypothetical protein C5167_031461 [Papaver somniferum]